MGFLIRMIALLVTLIGVFTALDSVLPEHYLHNHQGLGIGIFLAYVAGLLWAAAIDADKVLD